jgi:CDP-diacylglycerol pyrophosphatase
MRITRCRAGLSVILLVLVIIAATLLCWLKTGNPNTLWQIISQKCLVNFQQNHNPAPCRTVDEPQGFVVLKDLQGPLQYLLMPTRPISGIESPALLLADTPNYFLLAWQARHFLSEKYGQPIDDQDLALAINSPSGRSQNQLHIHISCLSAAVKESLAAYRDRQIPTWQILAQPLQHHQYWIRRISFKELQQLGAFRLLANGLAQGNNNMAEFSLAMVSASGEGFLLLATERNRLIGNFASAEELEDHQCQVLPELSGKSR